jgi:CheY-like chemotaxis protein
MVSLLESFHTKKITTAINGLDALQTLSDAEGIDIALIDLHMPKMDGLEVARQLHKLNCPIPLVALTADILPETRKKAKAAGMEQFLTKPFINEDLHKIVLVLTSDTSIKSFDTDTQYPEAQTAPNIQLSEANADNYPQQLLSRNIEKAVKTAANDKQLADNLFKQFINELDKKLPALESACNQKNLDFIKEEVHKFCGAAAVCGLEIMLLNLRKMEAASIAKDITVVIHEFDQIKSEFSHLKSL